MTELVVTACNGPVIPPVPAVKLPEMIAAIDGVLVPVPGERRVYHITFAKGDVEFHMRWDRLFGAKRTLFLYNGAVDLERKKRPIFQRSTWSREFDANVVNIEDPTVYLDPTMPIGWGQGTLDHYYSETVATIVDALARVIGSTSENHLHFGSSAGGYQAIVVGSLDAGSTVAVNNPQIDWTKHFVQRVVDDVVKFSFPGLSVSELREKYPTRVNALKYAAQHGGLKRLIYWVNAGFVSDVDDHLKLAITEYARSSQVTQDFGIEIGIYRDPERGHNPMVMDKTIHLLSRILQEIPR